MASSQPILMLPTLLFVALVVGILVTTPPVSAQTVGDIPGAELITVTTGTIPSGPDATTANITASGSPALKLAASTGSVSRQSPVFYDSGYFFYSPPKHSFIKSLQCVGFNKKFTRAYFKVRLGGKLNKIKTVYVRVPKGTVFIGLYFAWCKSALYVETYYMSYSY